MANLGLVIAAQGREQEAAQTYRRFIGLVEAQAARGRDPIEREELYSSSLTTLEKLARLEPARAPLVLRLQGMLTAAWASHKAEPAMGSGQAQGTLRLAASQTGFAAKLRYSGVMPGDPTAWAVYYRARGAMTGSTSGSCRTSGCGTWWPTGPPGLHRSTGPVSRPATCGSTSWLPAGAWPRPRPNAAPCPPGSSRSLTAAPACPGVGPPPGR